MTHEASVNWVEIFNSFFICRLYAVQAALERGYSIDEVSSYIGLNNRY